MSSSYRSCPSSPYLVFAQYSAGASPGAGIIGATRTRSFTGTRSHTSGAVKPPSDCATTTRSVRFPIAPTTASVYSASPAASSSHGRSGATVSWPRSRRSASTRCQYQPTSPAPWIRTNVLIPRPPCVLQSPFRTPWPVWNDAVEAMDSSVRPRKRSTCWCSSPPSRSATTRLHDPGARVEPDAVCASVRRERLSEAPEGPLRRCGAHTRKDLLRAREAADPLERRRDVPTVVDGSVDVGEGDVREARRIEDPLDLRRIGQ